MFLTLRTLFVTALLTTQSVAQGYAGLGAEVEGDFALPDPDYRFEFPADHGSHPDFRIEWWYVTANLTDASGAEYGLQWTLFRSALAPGEGDGWDSPQIWMGHAGLTTPDTHYVGERFARGGIGQAGVVPEPFEAWIDNWSFAGPTINDATLTASGEGFSYTLDITADAPLVPQGEQGYSVKSADGQASHYYSQPFYQATGTLMVEGAPIPVTGTAWLDREWSSQPLSDGQTGWDWFSLSLDDGARVMAARMRQTDGAPYYAGTWITPQGTPTPLGPDELTFTPLATSDVSNRDIPTAWRIEIPAYDVQIEATALQPDAWMDTLFSYWEGPMRLTGSHTGRGYLEMTGYEERE